MSCVFFDSSVGMTAYSTPNFHHKQQDMGPFGVYLCVTMQQLRCQNDLQTEDDDSVYPVLKWLEFSTRVAGGPIFNLVARITSCEKRYKPH